MKLQTQPSKWSCLPTSFAICLDVEVSCIFEFLGHDGSEIIWPKNPDPECRKGFHIQEMIDVADQCGYAVTPIEALPCLHPRIQDPPYRIKVNAKRFERYLQWNTGILTGLHEGGKNHAVVWNGEKVFDPRGFITSDLSLYSIQTLWMLSPIYRRGLKSNQCKTF